MLDMEGFKRGFNPESVFSRYFGQLGAKKNVPCINPLHKDKNPSMSIDPRLGLFYCHACHISGDVISLVEVKEGVDFKEAVSIIASWFGLQSPFDHVEYKRTPFELSQAFFETELQKSQVAMDYVKSRGISMEWASRLGIGYAPYDMRPFMSLVTANKDIDFSVMLKDGAPKLAGRITFPTRNKYGMVENFIARSVRGETPKYYKVTDHKCLYGTGLLNRLTGPVVLVEGPSDHAVLTQVGIRTIALLGTAMVRRDVFLPLLPYGKLIYVCLDPDEAGRDATRRCMGELFAAGFSPKVIDLPGGKDPDEVVIEGGREAFDACVEKAKSASEWLVSTMEPTSALSAFRGIISRCPDRAIRELQSAEFSSLLGISQDSIQVTSTTEDYDRFLFSAVKLYPDLYEQVLSGEYPEWIKNLVSAAPPPSGGITVPTKKEVQIGFKRILRAGVQARRK